MKKRLSTKIKSREQLVARMGVNPENDWAATYEILPDKQKVVAELKRLAASADEVYLATDLDREERRSPGICSNPLVATTVGSNGLFSMRSRKRQSKRLLSIQLHP